MKTMKKYNDGGGKITRSDIKNAQRAAKLKRIEAGTEPSTYEKVSNIAGKVADTAASAASATKAVKDIRSGSSSNPGGMKMGGSKMKMQDGGPIEAMQKAMGQKPVSTKKTMKYVRKHGSGYIPSGNKGYDAYKKSAIEKTGSEDAARQSGMIKKAGGAKYKTGGMVNPNAKLQAGKKATGKVGGISKAISKVAVKSTAPKGRVGGTSVAPKKAIPKAKYGMTMKKMQDGGPAGTSPESQIKRAMIKNSFNNARNITKARSGKPNGKI